MEISDFSSLIEVGVTLNIACVAVEYVKSYTSVLCNQVFSLGSLIKSAVKECRMKLNEVMDETTLYNLPDSFVGGRSIVSLKRQLTKDRKKLTDDIKNKEREMKNTVGNVCEVKNISSICLWLFLYGLSGLFIMGLENEYMQNSLIHLFWITLTFIGLLIITIGWINEGEERTWWKFGYCSLRFSLVSFTIATAISSLCLLLIKVPVINVIVEHIWNTVLIISMFMLYSNFVVSSIEVWNKAKKGKGLIEQEKNNMLQRCIKWNKDAKDLEGALQTDKRLDAQEKNTGEKNVSTLEILKQAKKGKRPYRKGKE